MHPSSWTGAEVSLASMDEERYLDELNARIRAEGLYPDRLARRLRASPILAIVPNEHRLFRLLAALAMIAALAVLGPPGAPPAEATGEIGLRGVIGCGLSPIDLVSRSDGTELQVLTATEVVRFRNGEVSGRWPLDRRDAYRKIGLTSNGTLLLEDRDGGELVSFNQSGSRVAQFKAPLSGPGGFRSPNQIVGFRIGSEDSSLVVHTRGLELFSVGLALAASVISDSGTTYAQFPSGDLVGVTVDPSETFWVSAKPSTSGDRPRLVRFKLSLRQSGDIIRGVPTNLDAFPATDFGMLAWAGDGVWIGAHDQFVKYGPSGNLIVALKYPETTFFPRIAADSLGSVYVIGIHSIYVYGPGGNLPLATADGRPIDYCAPANRTTGLTAGVAPVATTVASTAPPASVSTPTTASASSAGATTPTAVAAAPSPTTVVPLAATAAGPPCAAFTGKFQVLNKNGFLIVKNGKGTYTWAGGGVVNGKVTKDSGGWKLRGTWSGKDGSGTMHIGMARNGLMNGSYTMRTGSRAGGRWNGVCVG